MQHYNEIAREKGFASVVLQPNQHAPRECLIDNHNEQGSDRVGKTLDDEVFASAILNRLLYRCEVIKLSGQSYSMRNRKSIFNKK